MATKREELRAWKRLKEAFPGEYVTLELVYSQYSSGSNDTVKYWAYADGESGHGILSKKSRYLTEVVDDLIEKAEKENMKDGKATCSNGKD